MTDDSGQTFTVPANGEKWRYAQGGVALPVFMPTQRIIDTSVSDHWAPKRVVVPFPTQRLLPDLSSQLLPDLSSQLPPDLSSQLPPEVQQLKLAMQQNEGIGQQTGDDYCDARVVGANQETIVGLQSKYQQTLDNEVILLERLAKLEMLQDKEGPTGPRYSSEYRTLPKSIDTFCGGAENPYEAFAQYGSQPDGDYNSKDDMEGGGYPPPAPVRMMKLNEPLFRERLADAIKQAHPKVTGAKVQSLGGSPRTFGVRL